MTDKAAVTVDFDHHQPEFARDRMAARQQLLSWHVADNDPDMFECSEEVRLDRAKNRHLAFASGPHRCIGARFAKAEWEIVTWQMLQRLPDFTVVEE
jgi:cytochrome P450